MEYVNYPSFYESWFNLLGRILAYGDLVSPRTFPTQELTCVAFRVENGLNNILVHPKRGLNYKFMLAEALWILNGQQDLATIAQYNSRIAQFSDDGAILAGAYGPRLMPQIPWLLEKLQEPDTRQAVATIWRPSPPPSRDQCCTIALQFLIRGKLNLIVTMRSSDIWLGLPYDFFTFSAILNTVACQLNLEVGWIHFNLGSSHLYMSNREQAQSVHDAYFTGFSLATKPYNEQVPGWLFEVLRNPRIPYSTALQPWGTYSQVLSGKRDDALPTLIRTHTP